MTESNIKAGSAEGFISERMMCAIEKIGAADKTEQAREGVFWVSNRLRRIRLNIQIADNEIGATCQALRYAGIDEAKELDARLVRQFEARAALAVDEMRAAVALRAVEESYARRVLSAAGEAN